MKTGSFFLYTGPGRISIARFAPRDTPPGFRVYKPLAPGPWFNTVDERCYRELYFAQLALLDPCVVVTELEALAGAGVEPVLLCYEHPRDIAAGKTFCHRRMVSEWFQRELGIDVPEMGGAQPDSFSHRADFPHQEKPRQAIAIDAYEAIGDTPTTLPPPTRSRLSFKINSLESPISRAPSDG